jgi:nicotinamidase-related amidase
MEMEADWDTGAWLKGTPGPEIVDALRPKPGDIEYVAFAGFHTNWYVESSARSAYDKGYRVIVISDCTGTDTQREQEYAEQVIFPKIGTVMTSDELLAALELGAPQPAGVA